MHMSSRNLFNSEEVAPTNVQKGDFVRASGWSRPRMVVHTDSEESGPVLFMEDPDERFVDKPRRVNQEEWNARAPWVRYPNLRALWGKAHD